MSDEKTIEDLMREAVHDPVNDEECVLRGALHHVTAAQLAREHAEARARPLREALDNALDEIRGIQSLRRGHAPNRVYSGGLFDCDRIDALSSKIKAALAADAQHRGDAIKVTGVDYGRGPSRTVHVEMCDGVITSISDAGQGAEGGR